MRLKDGKSLNGLTCMNGLRITCCEDRQEMLVMWRRTCLLRHNHLLRLVHYVAVKRKRIWSWNVHLQIMLKRRNANRMWLLLSWLYTRGKLDSWSWSAVLWRMILLWCLIWKNSWLPGRRRAQFWECLLVFQINVWRQGRGATVCSVWNWIRLVLLSIGEKSYSRPRG